MPNATLVPYFSLPLRLLPAVEGGFPAVVGVAQDAEARYDDLWHNAQWPALLLLAPELQGIGEFLHQQIVVRVFLDREAAARDDERDAAVSRLLAALNADTSPDGAHARDELRDALMQQTGDPA